MIAGSVEVSFINYQKSCAAWGVRGRRMIGIEGGCGRRWRDCRCAAATAANEVGKGHMGKKLRSIAAALALLSLLVATPGGAQVICSGDLPPEGTAITATGTSTICGGACRARKFSTVQGSTMIICAQQPIPTNYTLQSVTTSPSCNCLGDQDNAYVIRENPAPSPSAVGPTAAGPTPTNTGGLGRFPASSASGSSAGPSPEPFQVGN